MYKKMDEEVIRRGWNSMKEYLEIAVREQVNDRRIERERNKITA